MLTKIINGKVLLRTSTGYTVDEKSVLVNGNTITKIGNITDEESKGAEVIDAKGMLLAPGFINSHTHVYMTLMRNYADDVEFGEWLFNRCMPVEDRLDKDAAYWGNLLGQMEMIKTGTTAYVDMHMFHEQSCKAANESGMRAFIGRGLVGGSLYEEGNNRFKEAIEEMEKYKSDTLSFILSPHAIYSASEQLLREVVEESDKRGLLRQTHLSEGMTEIENCLKEHGKTPVEYLNDIGFLSPKTLLAHCVQMQGNDIEIIAKSGSSVVSNPASNSKLGNGFAPINEMRKAGINVCLGTDGTASNNSLNLYREMAIFTMIHKGLAKDPTAAEANFCLDSVSYNAAKALNMESKLGELKEGAYADIQFINLDSISLFPHNNIVSSLVYSANGSEVDSVMIAGKLVFKHGEFLTIDKERVMSNVNRIKEKFL